MEMRTRTALWFECKVKHEKVQEDGLMKKVTEQYTIDALSYAEAENRIIEEMSSHISGEFTVDDIKKAAYKEVFFADELGDGEVANLWYLAKLQFINIDEKTEKEKRSNVTYLVQAGSFDKAVRGVKQVMGTTMIDYVIAAVSETKLMDVFEYGKEEAGKENEQPEYEK